MEISSLLSHYSEMVYVHFDWFVYKIMEISSLLSYSRKWCMCTLTGLSTR